MSVIAPDAQIDAVAASEEAAGRKPWQIAWEKFREDRLAMAGLVFICLMILFAIFAPVTTWITGHGPNELFTQQMTDQYGLPKGPNSSFWFGADTSGRDVFVRVAYGARVSLLVGIVATGIALLIGTVVGVLAGYRGGWLDTLVSRSADIVLAMPLIIFAIGIVAACSTSKQGCLGGLLQPGLGLVIVVIALFTWPYVARLVRGSTLSLREKEFVEASRAVGSSELKIMFSEILPNLVSPLVVYASLLIPSNILFESYLSFLGLGTPPQTPSWGRMLADSVDVFDVAWWFWLFPGIFLVLTVLAFNLVGDGLRDALDPKST